MKRPAEDGDNLIHRSNLDNNPLGDRPNNRNLSSTPSATMARLDIEKVAILDCGAQYGKVIDRRCRELCVDAEILPLSTPATELIKQQFKAVIISGGPKSVYATDAPAFDKEVFHCGLPVLGICYGFQLINKEFGGRVEHNANREDGQFEVTVDPSSPLFKDMGEKQRVLLTHGDSVMSACKGFQVIAKSGTVIAGLANPSTNIYGVQFHPEVDLSINGKKMLDNFLKVISGLKGTYTMQSREASCTDEIKTVVKNKKVLVFVSGGVDSTVCAALLSKALGREQVIAVHIDNGFMRKQESLRVAQSLRQETSVNLHLRVHSKSHLFYNATTEIVDKASGERLQSGQLNRTVDPEIKRHIIGDTFMRIKDEIIERLKLNPEDVIFAQGTLRPDLIESASALASGYADAIKTHHNDTELVRQLRKKGSVIEPLRDFHKDEVRRLGRDLGLPDSIVQRHPFPGPGLAIRILCALDPFKDQAFTQTQLLLRAIAQFHESRTNDNSMLVRILDVLSPQDQDKLAGISKLHGLHSTLLPIKSVGVQGDQRSYSYVATLSSPSEPIPWSDLMWVARAIPRICHNINRVVYVFGPVIEEVVLDITPTLLTQDTIRLLQECDDRATRMLLKHDAMDRLSQMPIILTPIHFDRPAGSLMTPSVLWSVVIRTFITNDFMTGVPAVPGQDIPENVILDISTCIEAVPMISRVMYDLTAKPPGTTEWE